MFFDDLLPFTFDEPFYLIYWVLAIVGSFIFVVQTLSLFIGFDTDTDFSGGDPSFDTDGLNLLSLKPLSGFLLGVGWTGVICYPMFTEHPWWLAALAFGVGLSFMVLLAFLLRQVLRLTQDNTFHVVQCIGQRAQVYLRIPAGGAGKVVVSLNGTTHELRAVSAGKAELSTGMEVNVVDVIDDDTLLVEATQ